MNKVIVCLILIMCFCSVKGSDDKSLLGERFTYEQQASPKCSGIRIWIATDKITGTKYMIATIFDRSLQVIKLEKDSTWNR